MKKILFNGCSFVAGDAVVWEQYHAQFNKSLVETVTDFATRLDAFIKKQTVV